LDPLRSMLPTSFGVQKKQSIQLDVFSKTKRIDDNEEKGIKLNMTNIIEHQKHQKRAKEDEDEDKDTLPISHEIKLNDHTRSVSALALDPAGARLITGGYDYDVKFWDFAGMDSTLRPFRTIKPSGDHQV
ncbi:699_t:CDS:2, partial [Diversispora eburnea]